MNNQFDELTKNMAQSVTRRAALKKLGFGLAGMMLSCFGLATKARAATYRGYCQAHPNPFPGVGDKGNTWALTGQCIVADPTTGFCSGTTSSACQPGQKVGKSKPAPCNGYWSQHYPCSYTP